MADYSGSSFGGYSSEGFDILSPQDLTDIKSNDLLKKLAEKQANLGNYIPNQEEQSVLNRLESQRNAELQLRQLFENQQANEQAWFDPNSLEGAAGNTAAAFISGGNKALGDILTAGSSHFRNKALEQTRYIDLQKEESRLSDELRTLNNQYLSGMMKGNPDKDLFERIKGIENKLSNIGNVLESRSSDSNYDINTGEITLGKEPEFIDAYQFSAYPTNRENAANAERVLPVFNAIEEAKQKQQEAVSSIVNRQYERDAAEQALSYAPDIIKQFNEGDYVGAGLDTVSAIFNTIIDNPKASVQLLSESLPQMYMAVQNLPVATASLYEVNKAEMLDRYTKEQGKGPDAEQIAVMDQAAFIAAIADTGSDYFLAKGGDLIFGMLGKVANKADIPSKVIDPILRKLPAPVVAATAKVTRIGEEVLPTIANSKIVRTGFEAATQPIQEAASGATTAYAQERGAIPLDQDVDLNTVAQQAILEGVATGPIIGAQTAKAALGTGVGVAKDTVKTAKEAFKGTGAERLPDTGAAPSEPVEVTVEAYTANPQAVLDKITKEGIPGATDVEIKSLAGQLINASQDPEQSKKILDAARESVNKVRSLAADVEAIKANTQAIIQATPDQAKTEEFQKTLGSTIEALYSSLSTGKPDIDAETAQKLSESPYLTIDQKVKATAISARVNNADEVDFEIAGGTNTGVMGISDYLQTISDAVAVDAYDLASEYAKKYKTWIGTQKDKVNLMNRALQVAERLQANPAAIKTNGQIDPEKIKLVNQNMAQSPANNNIRISDSGDVELQLKDRTNTINVTSRSGGIPAYRAGVVERAKASLAVMEKGAKQVDELIKNVPVKPKTEVKDAATKEKSSTKPAESKPAEKAPEKPKQEQASKPAEKTATVTGKDLNNPSKVPENPTKTELAIVLKYLLGEEKYRNLKNVTYVEESDVLPNGYIQYEFFTEDGVLHKGKVNIHKNYKNIIRKSFPVHKNSQVTLKPEEEIKDGKEEVQEKGQQEDAKQKDVVQAKEEVKTPPKSTRIEPKLSIQGFSVTFKEAKKIIKSIPAGGKRGKPELIKLLDKVYLTETETEMMNQLLDKLITNNSDIILEDPNNVDRFAGLDGITAAEYFKDQMKFFKNLVKLYRAIEQGKC
jgi:hypothetical protein